MTVGEFLDSTARHFESHGVDSPKLTAELLLAEALQTARLDLYLEPGRPIPLSALATLDVWVKKRAQRFPLQYCQGFASFLGQRFVVSPSVLIPRPETEMLFEAFLKHVNPDPKGGSLVDVGTGSGILAICLAQRFPHLQVLGLDQSQDALEMARHNGKDLANLRFEKSDLLEKAPDFTQGIVANLPYIPSGLIDTLEPEVRHEPRKALDGGADGMDLIRRLIAQARGRTRCLALEIGDNQGQEVQKIYRENGFEVVDIVSDLRQQERVIIGCSNG